MTNVISDNSEQFKLTSGKPISRHPPVALFSSFSSSTVSSITQTHVCACWERRGAVGSLSPLAGWTLARDWLWLPMETWSLTWNSPAQSWWGDLMRILSCDVFRVCECELSLCTGSKGRKVSLRQQWQSLKMGHILNKSILTCSIFLLIWKECCEAISTGSLE